MRIRRWGLWVVMGVLAVSLAGCGGKKKKKKKNDPYANDYAMGYEDEEEKRSLMSRMNPFSRKPKKNAQANGRKGRSNDPARAYGGSEGGALRADLRHLRAQRDELDREIAAHSNRMRTGNDQIRSLEDRRRDIDRRIDRYESTLEQLDGRDYARSRRAASDYRYDDEPRAQPTRRRPARDDDYYDDYDTGNGRAVASSSRRSAVPLDDGYSDYAPDQGPVLAQRPVGSARPRTTPSRATNSGYVMPNTSSAAVQDVYRPKASAAASDWVPNDSM